jgi:hypothetical protein
MKIHHSRKQTDARIYDCGETCFSHTTGWCVAIVDRNDSWLLQEYKWYASGKYFSDVFYPKSWRYGRETGKSELLHQAITGHAYDQLDHINGNGHDCRRSSLRPVTQSQNSQNQKARKYSCRSRYKGVVEEGSKWRARIRANGHEIYLGTFDNEVDAARAYNASALVAFGEFARINIIPDPRPPWSTPILTELEYTPELRDLYRQSAPMRRI